MTDTPLLFVQSSKSILEACITEALQNCLSMVVTCDTKRKQDTCGINNLGEAPFSLYKAFYCKEVQDESLIISIHFPRRHF